MIGRSKARTSSAKLAVVDAVHGAFGSINQAQVRREQTGLPHRADGAGAGQEIVERDRRPDAECGPVLQTHRGFGDHPERAFRADHQAIRARPRAGAGQPAALQDARGRHHAQAFDEVIDMGVERGEVAAERVAIQPPSVEHSKPGGSGEREVVRLEGPPRGPARGCRPGCAPRGWCDPPRAPGPGLSDRG